MNTNISLPFLEKRLLHFPPFSNSERHRLPTILHSSISLLSIRYRSNNHNSDRDSLESPSEQLMARAFTHRILITFITLSLFLQLIAGDPALLRNRHHGARPAMLLPLYLSAPNATTSALDPRRQLYGSESKRHPNARMRLHDDLLLNG